MKIKYPSLEYRDLSQEHNRTFRDPGSYAEKIFICETGSAERLLTPVGRFDNGFTVVIYNKGPYDVIFDAAIPDDAIKPRAAPSKACTFMYSAHDKMWYGPNHSNIHESGNIDELDGDKIDIDWNPSNYSAETSPSEVDSADHLTAHLSGIDTALRTYTQVSEPSDPSAGNSVVYSSDGSSSDENAGDFILKVNVGGTVKKHWLFTF